MANASGFLNLSALMIENVEVVAILRDALMDMWITVSPYLNCTDGCAGHAMMQTVIRFLDHFRDGADMSRFMNCGEELARLAACSDRN